MATPTYLYVTSSLAGVYQELSETAPSNALLSPATGWIIGTASDSYYSEFRPQTERASSTFAAGGLPDGSLDTTNGDGWRSATAITGYISPGTWEVSIEGKAVTSASGQELIVRVRLFKGTAANGSNATEFGGGTLATALIGPVSTFDQWSRTISFSLATQVFSSEYLFIQVACQRATGGSMTSADFNLIGGTSGCLISIPPELLPATVTPNALTQAQNSGEPTLTQHNILTPNSLTQAQSLPQPTVQGYVWGSKPVTFQGAAAQITCTSRSYTLTGNTTVLKRGLKLTCTSRSYALTGNATALKRGFRLTCTSRSYALTGNTTALKAGRKVLATTRTYALTGNTTALKRGLRLTCATRTYTLTGVATVLRRGKRLACTVQTYTVSTVPAVLRADRKLTCAVRAYIITGNATALKRGIRLSATTQSYALTGIATALKRGIRLPATIRTYALTGYATALKHGSKLLLTTQVYALTGYAVTFVYDSGFALLSVDSDNSIAHGQTGIIILPSTGKFAASGNRVTIDQGSKRINQTVTAESIDSITITANLAGLTAPGSATLYVHKPRA